MSAFASGATYKTEGTQLSVAKSQGTIITEARGLSIHASKSGKVSTDGKEAPVFETVAHQSYMDIEIGWLTFTYGNTLVTGVVDALSIPKSSQMATGVAGGAGMAAGAGSATQLDNLPCVFSVLNGMASDMDIVPFGITLTAFRMSNTSPSQAILSMAMQTVASILNTGKYRFTQYQLVLGGVPDPYKPRIVVNREQGNRIFPELYPMSAKDRYTAPGQVVRRETRHLLETLLAKAHDIGHESKTDENVNYIVAAMLDKEFPTLGATMTSYKYLLDSLELKTPGSIDKGLIDLFAEDAFNMVMKFQTKQEAEAFYTQLLMLEMFINNALLTTHRDLINPTVGYTILHGLLVSVVAEFAVLFSCEAFINKHRKQVVGMAMSNGSSGEYIDVYVRPGIMVG